MNGNSYFWVMVFDIFVAANVWVHVPIAFSCAEDVGFSDGGFGGGDNDAEEAQILPVPISVGPKL
jgi:hypothetical protein